LQSEQERWEARLQRIEARLCREGRHDLDVLEKAGADRQRLVRLLAVTASGGDDWKRLMRSRQEALRSIAKRLETLTRDAEKLADDPLSTFNFWVFLVGGGFAMGLPEPKTWKDRDPGAHFVITGMRSLAKCFEQEAARFGRYLRQYAQTDSGLVLLLLAVYRWTRSTQHFEELARLLTDAFEAAGKPKCFSADGLEKTSKRHVPRRIRLLSRVQEVIARESAPPEFPPVVLPDTPRLR